MRFFVVQSVSLMHVPEGLWGESTSQAMSVKDLLRSKPDQREKGSLDKFLHKATSDCHRSCWTHPNAMCSSCIAPEARRSIVGKDAAGAGGSFSLLPPSCCKRLPWAAGLGSAPPPPRPLSLKQLAKVSWPQQRWFPPCCFSAQSI